MKSNFERMIELAAVAFDARNDAQQLDVDESVIAHLQKLHPSSVSEYDDGKGPVVWILLIPTTTEIMYKFLENKISETEVMTLTPLNQKYDAIYLCSAMVLEEYRKKGIAKRMTIEAIENIRKVNPVKSLFVWPFSEEGERLAEVIGQIVKLPLCKRK